MSHKYQPSLSTRARSTLTTISTAKEIAYMRGLKPVHMSFILIKGFM